MDWNRHVWSLCALAALLICMTADAQVLINEFDSNQAGSDTQEFIELYVGVSGVTDLSGLIVVLYSGATDASYLTIDLTGYLTDTNGFFTIGSTGMGSPIEISPGTQGWLENGPDAIAVYADLASNFPNGTPVTPINLVDAVVYSNDNVQAPNLIAALLQSGELQLNENGIGYGETVSMSRCPDGSGLPWTTSPFTYGLPTHMTYNDCSFATPTSIPTSTPTETPTRTPTLTPTPTATLPPAPTCDAEYVENGGMESWATHGSAGPPDAWSLTFFAGVTFTVEQDTAPVYSGSSSARLSKTGIGPNDAASISQVVPFQVVPDTIYTFSAQVYDNDPAGYLHIFVQWRDSANGYIGTSLLSNNSIDMDDWQLLSLSDTSPPNAYYARVQIRLFDINNEPVEVHLDDVSLVEPCDPIPTPTPTLTPTPTMTPTQAQCGENFLANPSFEDWSGVTIDDWFGDTGILIQQETINVHDGATAANVSRTMSGTDMTSIYMSVSGQSLYDAGIWIIDNDPDLNARFYVLFYNGNMDWVGSSDWYDTSGENPDYQEYSFTRLLAPINAVWARMRVRFINNDGSYPPATGITATITVDDGWIVENCDSSTPTPNPTPTPANYHSIYSIQYTTDPSGDSPYINQIVRTSGIVTAVESGHPDVFIQDGVGAWNGLHLTIPTGPGSLQKGDLLFVQGMVTEIAGMTTILAPDYLYVQNSGNPLPDIVDITTDVVNQEAYEGVLVRLNNLVVTSINAGPGEWEAGDINGVMRVDDMFTYSYLPTLGEILDWIQGPMSSDTGVFKLQPRNDADISLTYHPLPSTNVWGILILLTLLGGLLAYRMRR